MKINNLLGIRANARKSHVHQSISLKLMRECRRFLLLYLCTLFALIFSLPAVSLAETYVSGNITVNTTWTLEGSPYYLLYNEIRVGPPDATAPSVTLTIEPGVSIFFGNGESEMIQGRLIIDQKGILIARGTETEPVLFERYGGEAGSGRWGGIEFASEIENTDSIVENCIIQHADSAIRFMGRRVLILSNIIRSNTNGIHYIGGGSAYNLTIECNRIEGNTIGIYCTGGCDYWVVRNNAFIGHYRSIEGPLGEEAGDLHAENNYFYGNYQGILGNVYTEPQLTSIPACVPDFNNSPPNAPHSPIPADGATNVEGNWNGHWGFTVSWQCTDPDPDDTLKYSIDYGTDPDNLNMHAGGEIAEPTWSLSYLLPSTTYYWRITARDQLGAETAGPVWQFTTAASPIDLTPTEITWTPETDILGNDNVTFTGSFQKNGEGTTGHSFMIDFRIDDISIATERIIRTQYDDGEIFQVSKTWPAAWGQHTIEVVIDSLTEIYEFDETNNNLSAALPEIIDPDPPNVESTHPEDASHLQEVNNIVIALNDIHGVVDAAVLSNSIAVMREGQVVEGTVTDANNEFTFSPSTSPLPDGNYQVSFTAADMAGNTADHTFIFTVDSQAPSKPTITGGTVTSGVIQVRPAQNSSNSTSVTLTGTRDDNTSVWINNAQRVSLGSGDWSVNLTLSQGDNALEIWEEDAAGNGSASEWVDILVDSVAPVISGITPPDNSFLNAPPASVVIEYVEETSDLNLDTTTHSIKDSSLTEEPGTWTTSGGNQLIFTPAGTLIESNYTVDVQLEDNLGNRGTAAQYHFTVDTTPPPPPEINPVTSPAHNPNQTISGTKEAYASILLDGEEVVSHTAETTWEHTVTLTSGTNQFTFAAKDRAGNQSEGVLVEIVYDDIPPQAVDTLTVNGEGDGTTVTLDWTGYDESFHGDIASYRIYYETASFSDVSGLTICATVSVGTFIYVAQNLTKGTTYWFAVVAVDIAGNALTTVSPVSGVPTDTVAPEDVTNLRVESFETRLVFTWDHSANTNGDLEGYKVYFNNATEGVSLPSSQNTHEETDLSSATAYPFKVTAYDTGGNESAGTSITGITWLPNPANLTASPYSGYVDLTWDGVEPSQYVKHYAVYVSETDFSTVESMTPTLTATGTSANVAGLTNDTTYFFAVTTVNLSNGERKTVNTTSAMPVADTEGPEITNVQVGGVALVDGHILTKPATFTLNATDPAGVSRVEFSIDGTLIRTDYNGSPHYDCYWNIVPEADGGHILTIVAFDSLGNTATVEYGVNVALEPPLAPTITQPASGLVTNQPTIAISGYAEKYTEIILYKNTVPASDPADVDALGNFSISLTLTEGANQIQAVALNRAGTSNPSTAVLVTLDTTIPESPTNLTAQSKEGGVIKLSWRAPADTSVKGYNLYRSTTSFTSIGQAQKVNNNLITLTTFDDLPAEDGTYYYRITTMSTSDNESELSAEVSAQSDSTMPRAVSIAYTPQGNYDPGSGRMAPGVVDLVLTMSEALQSTPFLSITPEGGVPISVELNKVSDLQYSGFFVISDTTPTGTAYAIFSGRDMVGNRGTEIDSGGSIKIDTDGPSVRRITLQPDGLIKNDENDPVSITVTIGLTDAMKPGEVPTLSYLLSGEGRTEIAVENLTQVSAQPEEAQAWEGTFVFSADAGLTEPETFYFIYQGVDDLENIRDRFLCNNLFQVYQGELPPLEPPTGLTGESLPGGKIKLTWNVVEEAVDYQIYRKAPGETDLTEYVRASSLSYTSIENQVSSIDTPSIEGVYTYAIASIREENEQESTSGMSASIEVVSDSVVPGAPQNLALELVANGIKAEWEAPSYTEAITYSLYRADTTEITSVEGLTPLATGITQTMVVDPNPSPTDHCYVVTSVDEAGNESAPSNSSYLDFDLLPVSSLHVVQTDTDSPVVSWTHPGGNIAGYDIYLGPEGEDVKLNPELLTELTYTDTGYAGDERRYTVIAVNPDNVESLGRSITLPMMTARLATRNSQPATLKRGIMNRLDYTVESSASTQVNQIHLKVRVESYDHISEVFSLDTGDVRDIPVVVGGYDDLPDVAALTTTIEITPNAGETVEIVRTSQIDVADGMLVVQILNEEFTRGATGSVRFTMENTGEAEIEIITARNNGNSGSNEVTYYLMDVDDNVLTSMPFKQALGEGIVTLSNGNTVSRIPAGSTFSSETMDMPVPGNAPDDVVILLDISNLYFHHGKTDQVKMDGLSTSHAISLIDTSYYGEVLSITPESSNGDQDIIITGRAVERATESPMTEVPLKLVITVNGFDRTYEIFTDVNGGFSYTFTPLSGESGVYTVRAVHPDLLDRPVHGTFTINRVTINPATINLSIPKNYEKTIPIRVNTGDGTEVNNLELIYEEADQSGGVFPQGVHLTLPSPVSFLGSKSSTTLPIIIWADNTAEETGTLILKVKSDETSPDAWGTVTVNTHFSEAQPVLQFTPDHVETGVAQDDTDTVSIVLKNTGLAELNDVSLTVVYQNGNPAPDWVHLNSAADQGSIQVGEQRPISIAFNPTEATAPEGMYTFYLRVSSSNYQTTDIGLYVSVTLSGIGNALFKISDIYTGTLNENSEIIQGLSGARITVQNEEVTSIEEIQTTDSFGETYFDALPAGRYKYRVTANNHQEHIGRIWVKPAITTSEEVFLDYNLVTVEWEVTEITIEDRYEIVLTATYQTNVPAAVVVAEPSAITLPPMTAGDVYNGEFTLTNYGLIRAESIAFTLPEDDQNFRYELLGGFPQSIEAKERITVPYRVTCLQSLDQEEGGTGGGCYRYIKCANIDYGYKCANGVWTLASTQYCWIYSYGECGTVSGVPVIGGTLNIGGGAGGGSFSSPAPAPKPLDGPKCFPKMPGKECYCDPCERLKDTRQGIFQNTLSSVNTVLREYSLDVDDLSIKAPGGTISIKRWFYGNQWKWEHSRNNLKFAWDSLGSYIETIEKGGVIYKASSIDANLYRHDVYRITRTADGYRWEDKRGKWKEYDESGRMNTYGNRRGIEGKLIYEAGEDGNLIGITDRNDNQVMWFEYNTDGLISAAYDIDNRRVEYTYTDGLLTTVTDVLGNDTSYEYDTEGRIIKTIDAAGRESHITYDEYNSVASVVDSEGKGHFFEFDYDMGKREQYVRITTSTGRIKEVWYDKDGETIQVDINGRTVQKIAKDGRNLIITDERGNITRKEFDEWDNLTKVIYPDGSDVSYEYDLRFNRRSKEIDERGIITEYTYDDTGNMTRKVEAAGTADERITEYTYDSYGNQLTVKRVGDANTVEALTTMEYDASGNMTSITDPEGNITQFTHDNMGNVLTKENARNKVWTYEYDVMGRLKSITDPLNNITRLFYDGVGNKIREVDAEGKEKIYEYDQRNNLIKSTDAEGNITLFEYNTDGKLTKQTDLEGKEVYYQYDPDGRLMKTIDGNGNEIVMEYDDTSGSGCPSCSGGGGADQPSKIIYPTFVKEYTYDDRGRKIEEKDVLSETVAYLTQHDYDLSGNLISKIDKEDKTTSYEYDSINRLIKVTDPANKDTAYVYDDRDNLIQLTDANGNTTWFEYDRNNRLVKEIRPMGEETSYQYDGVGNLAQKIDAKNQKTEYEYDDAGRLLEIQYFSPGDHVNPVKTVVFAYDKVGNLKTYNDATTSAEYFYDDAYRKTSETVNYGTFEKTYTYTYYKNGTKKSFTGPDSITYDYTYDSNNQLTGVQIPAKGFITYTAYTWNRPASMTLPGGSTKTYAYDPLMRVQSITAKDPGQNILLNYQYNYDKMDNILNKDTEHGDYAYDYDDIYRLIDVDNSTLDDEAFAYDPVGNRLTAEGVAGTWNYNDNNELTGYDDVSYEYDANGNMTQKTIGGVVTKFFYNTEGRLERVEEGDGTVIAAYYYDPFGRRLWKEAGGVKTYFLYADEGLIGEYDSTGGEIKTYGYKPGSTWTTDPLFMKEGSDYYFYHNDHLGTPQKLTSTNGAVVWSATYSSFGEATVDASSTIINKLRLPGQFYDQETGLHYNYHRYYGPKTGRYFRIDPSGLMFGLNHLYGYAIGNPIKYYDIFGLAPGDVYLFSGGGLAPGIASFSDGPWGHAAIEISGNRVLSAGIDDNGDLKVYIRDIDKELNGRSFDIFKPNYQVDVKALDDLALQLKGKNYLLDDGNVCAEVTAKGISVAHKDKDSSYWDKYIWFASPNDVGTDPRFNALYDYTISIEYFEKYKMYKIIKPSGSYYSPTYKRR